MCRRQTKETGPGPTLGDSAHARIHVHIFRCTVAVGAGRWLASALMIRESGIAKHEAACRGIGCACNAIASAETSGGIRLDTVAVVADRTSESAEALIVHTARINRLYC